MRQVLLKPVITEKSIHEANKGKFTFIVDQAADKEAIKKAIESAFGVHVTKVTVSIVKGKTQRVGMKRTEVKKSPLKKALVSLQPGEKIGLFEIGA